MLLQNGNHDDNNVYSDLLPPVEDDDRSDADGPFDVFANDAALDITTTEDLRVLEDALQNLEPRAEAASMVAAFFPPPVANVVDQATGGRADTRTTTTVPTRPHFQNLPIPPYDQLTIPTMYNLSQSGCGTMKKTEEKGRPTFKLWASFCKEIDRPWLVENFGLGLYGHVGGLFTEHSYPSSEEFDRSLVHDFLEYIVTCTGFSLHKSTVPTACGFLNAHLKAEYYVRLQQGGCRNAQLGRAEVGKDPVVKRKRDQAVTNLALARNQKKDLQSQVGCSISREECRAMLLMALGVDVEARGLVSRTATLSRIVFGCTFVASAAVLRRGEEFYKQRLVQRFARQINEIGPFGMKCDFCVTNVGKANNVGRLEYTAAAPHVDVLMDTSFWHGIMYLYLMLVCNYDLNKFNDYESLFDLPTYPSPRTFKNYTRQQYRLLWHRFFKDAKVHVDKLTHIWRGQGQRELDASQVPIPSIARMTGHSQVAGASAAQMKSYITNPPSDAVVGRAGGNPKQPEAHQPPRVTVEVVSSMLSQIQQVNELKETLEDLKRKKAACNSFKEVEEKRLFSCCGTIEHILHCIESAFRGLASRPVDPKTRVAQLDRPTIGELYGSSSTLRDVMNHPVFGSQQYANLKAAVRAAEDSASALFADTAQSSREIAGVQAGMQMLAANQNNLSALFIQRLDDMERILAGRHGNNVGTAATADSRNNVSSAAHSLLIAYRKSFPQQIAVTTAVPASPSDSLIVVPPDPQQDFLEKSNGPRKRRRAIDQRDILQAEGSASGAVPRPCFKAMDDHFKTFAEFMLQWLEKLRPLEVAHGNEWRRDLPVHAQSEGGRKKMKSNVRSTWVSFRRPIWFFVEYLLGQGCTVEHVVSEGEIVYQSAKRAEAQKRPQIKDVKTSFVATLTERKVWTGSSGGRQPSVLTVRSDDQLASEIAYLKHQVRVHGNATVEPDALAVVGSPPVADSISNDRFLRSFDI